MDFFTLKSSFCSQDISIFSLLFSNIEKQLDEKDKVHFKIYNVATWETNNCNTHIA